MIQHTTRVRNAPDIAAMVDAARRDTTALFHRIERTAVAGDYARDNGHDALADTLYAHRATLLAALDHAAREGAR